MRCGFVGLWFGLYYGLLDFGVILCCLLFGLWWVWFIGAVYVLGLCDVVTGFWWCCWLCRLVVCVGLWFAGVDLFVLDCGTWRCRFGFSFVGLYWLSDFAFGLLLVFGGLWVFGWFAM